MNTDKKYLIILDLDETLIHSSPVILKSKHDFKVGQFYVYKRPGLDSFLNNISQNFRVGIWSAADPDYVLEIVNNIIPNNIKIEFLWDQRWCDEKVIGKEHLFEKDLHKVQNILKINIDQLLLIDDNLHNLEFNIGNIQLIPPFYGSQDDMGLKETWKNLVKTFNVN